MLRFACLFLLVPAALCAEDKKPDPKLELAALKGKWKVTATTFNGRDTLPKGAERAIVFDEKEFTATDGTGKPRTLGFTLDPTTDPKRIDLIIPGSDKKVAGLYKRDGDTLTLCYAEPDGERPKKFESKEGEKVFLLVLTKVKE